MSNTLMAAGVAYPVKPPAGIRVAPLDTTLGFDSTYLRSPKAVVDAVVLHETGGRSTTLDSPSAGIFQTLTLRGLGIHFAVSPVKDNPTGALIQQYADPILEATAHTGGSVNERSVGIECIGEPARELSQADMAYWPNEYPSSALSRPWVPATAGQCEAVFFLWQWLASAAGRGSGIGPRIREVAGIAGGVLRVRALQPNALVGIGAHLQVNDQRADGLAALVYCAVRARGISAASAYQRMVAILVGEPAGAKTVPAQELVQVLSDQAYPTTRLQAAQVASARVTHRGPVFTVPQDRPEALAAGGPVGLIRAGKILVSPQQIRLYDFARGRWVTPGTQTQGP